MIWSIKWNDWPAAYNNPTLPLCLIYLILQLPYIPGSRTFTVCGPQAQPTLAWVGKDVPFSCHLSPKMDAQGMTVKWVRGPLVVHLYRMGQEVEEVQAPTFQGRTTLLRQDMAEGKVTLRIHQVQLSDAGQYTCYFQAGPLYSEANFDLLVAECQKGPFSVTGPAQLIQAKQGEDITLSCELSPKMNCQRMIVNWCRNQTLMHWCPNGEKLEESQSAEFQGRIELLKYNMAEGKVTLRTQQVQVSDSGLYTCHFQSSDYHTEAHIELHVTENHPTSQKTPTISIVAVSSVVLMVSILVIYFFCKTKLQRPREEFQSGRFQEEGREVAGTSRDTSASSEDLQLPQGLPDRKSISPLMILEEEEGPA
ncbi:butyrophilin-like protein 3 [Dromiciops gliroides]|uniref:butyrophilin-like protein 3 n=1 Tax=Dromiciops gliroides TaxID=33562 RepID=UPI001CC7BDAE|nr:butyrophilin-like protein 3 [Dromiciops gliroides]